MKKIFKRKTYKKGLLSLLSFLIAFVAVLQGPTNAFAAEEYENIALNKTVTASSQITGNEGKNVVDGSEETKWEVDKISDKPTLTIDLGQEELINFINLKWASNFAFKYKLYTAKSNKVYSQVIYHEENTGGTNEWEMEENTVAQYVKVEIIEANTGNTKVGLNEVEVLRIKKTGPVNIALNKPSFSSGNEANLERLGPKGAFDGNYTDVSNGRWSSQNITLNPQWIYVDLEEEKTFEGIHVLWENAYATNYVLQYSNDVGEDKTWTDIVTVEDGDGDWDKHNFNSVTARFVRLYATKSNGLGSAKPISIWEIEIYEKANDSLTVDDIANNFSIGTITESMDKMPTFTFDDNNIIASLFCSDNDIVVDDTGKINKPLVDKEILVTYKIKDIRTNDEKEVRNQKVIIPGKYKTLETDNAAPISVPTIQEWKGGIGTYQLTNSSRIIIQNEDLRKAADITKEDIKDSFNYNLSIVSNQTPQTGDIVLTYTGADKTVGEQGYTMDIQNYITISGNTYRGVFYGTRSILQSLTLGGDKLTIHKGFARDYSKYEYRKFMLDVARKYIPMSYLKDFVKYLSYYKFTDIQVHLNDTSYNGHSRFRLESDIEGLTATDGYYTKDEYRDFQYYAEDYGIRVISEFDTPAHSAVFINLFPELKFDPTHLDIRLNSPNKDKVYKFIADLYEEYMGGDNPVFVTDAFNVGLDEYNANYKEDMTQYSKYVMELVHDKYGKTPAAWASMGCLDSNQTKIPDYPVMDAWANYAVSLKGLFDQDYKLVNATNKYGYIVPGGNNGYPDFAKEEEIYNNLSAGKFRDKANAGIDVAEGHPKIVGGSASLWNDRGIFNGMSLVDVFARSKSIIPYYAQTYWYGKDESKSFSQFKTDITQLGDGPNVNIRSEIESKSDLVYDFNIDETTQDGSKLILKDTSGNGYDANVTNGKIISELGNDKLELQGNGYVEMEHKALTWPNSILFDIKIDQKNTQDIILFEENRPKEECDKSIDTKYNISKVYLKKVGNQYQLMFDRESYHYEHSYKFDVNKTYQIALKHDEKYSKLIVNGKEVSSINGPILTNEGNKWYDSASLEMPLQKIGQNLYGTLDNIKLYNRALSTEEILDIQEIISIPSLTTNKTVEVSSIDAPAAGTQNGPNAVDGNPSSRWTSNRATGNELHEWITIDLDDTYKVNRVEVDWEDACAKGYTVQVSQDGTSWSTVATITDGKKENRVITFNPVDAKFIKLDFTDKVSAKYGYSIYEIRAFESPNASLLKEIEATENALTKIDNVGMYEGQVNEESYNELKTRLSVLKTIANSNEIITDEKLVEYLKEMKISLKNISTNIVRIDLEKINASIKSIEELSRINYGKTQYNLAQTNLDNAKALLKGQYTQVMIDTMNQTLIEQLESLKNNELDRLGMTTLLESSKTLNKDHYTTASWDVFKDAYNLAEKIQANESVEKADFDVCYQNLENSISNLVLIKETELDFTKLKNEVQIANGLKENDYTEESWNAFKVLLIKAEVILKTSEISQNEIDSITQELKDARNSLVKRPIINPIPDNSKDNVVIKDSQNNITISGILPKGVQLETKVFTLAQIENLKELINKKDSQFLNQATLEKVYDINLLMNNIKYNFDGPIQIVMKLDKELENKNVGIIYIDEHGNVTKIKSTTDGEYITFNTLHLSTYAIVSYEDNNDEGVAKRGEVVVPKTNDTTNVLLFTFCAFGSMLIFLKKRKESVEG